MTSLDKIKESDFLKAFLTPDGRYIDKKGIESILYNIEDEEGIQGRAFHIGNGYFLTALHVIEPSNIRLFPQFKLDRSMHGQEFKAVYYDVDTDLALLKAAVEEGVDKPIVRLGERVSENGETVSGFMKFDGDKRDTDNSFQFIANSGQRFGRLILPTDSLLVEKQGEVMDNPNNPDPVSYAKYHNYCFFAYTPTMKGDSGSPIFLRIGDGKYLLSGISIRNFGSMHQIPEAISIFWDRRVYYSGAVIVHRSPIERLILQYLTKDQSPYKQAP